MSKPPAKIVPVTVSAARKWVAANHRHLPKLQGGLFAAGVQSPAGDLVGVAVAGNPPRVWQGTGRFVITRVAVLPGAGWDSSERGDHAAPYCTMLYGALCRAGKALGYSEVWTYTLPHEPGTSLKAAGFEFMGYTERERPEGFSRPSRPRAPAVRPEVKGRWRRVL